MFLNVTQKKKTLEVLVTDMERPNGIALSPDESHLFISNTGENKYIRGYEIDKSLKISNPIEFAKSDPDHVFDGFRFDINNSKMSTKLTNKNLKRFDLDKSI